MIKEKESQRYLQDRLASFVDPLSLAIAFLRYLTKKKSLLLIRILNSI